LLDIFLNQFYVSWRRNVFQSCWTLFVVRLRDQCACCYLTVIFANHFIKKINNFEDPSESCSFMTHLYHTYDILMFYLKSCKSSTFSTAATFSSKAIFDSVTSGLLLLLINILVNWFFGFFWFQREKHFPFFIFSFEVHRIPSLQLLVWITGLDATSWWVNWRFVWMRCWRICIIGSFVIHSIYYWLYFKFWILKITHFLIHLWLNCKTILQGFSWLLISVKMI